jgi:hypothetical protein
MRKISITLISSFLLFGTAGAQPVLIEGFEAPTADYWNGVPSSGIIFQQPTLSGTTVGIDLSSGWDLVTTPVVTGTQAGRLTLKWTNKEAGLCRITSLSARPRIETLDSMVSVWVHGTGDGSEIALIILDSLRQGGVAGEYEFSPYVIIDWTGWRKLQFRLPDVEWKAGFASGTGALEDPMAPAYLEGFFIRPGQDDQLVLFFDDITVEPIPEPHPVGWQLQ